MNQTFSKVLRRLGSAETTAALIVLGGGIALLGIFFPIRTADWMVLPLALLVINLLAALATSARLKSLPLLFTLHAALVVLIAVIGFDRLNAMSGRVEITEGALFDPALVTAEAGPLHRSRLNEVKFVQGPFEITYAPGMRRRETESTIRIPERGGTWRDIRVGDHTPLIFDNYRFYTTHNKGFAPVVTYVDGAGTAQTGVIHLPSYPMNDNRQGQSWTPPGTSKPLKVWLHMPEPVFEADKAWKFTKPVNTRLVLIDGDKRHELQVGEVAALGSAQVRYDGLRTWMGYTIVGQSLNHWIAATAGMACLVLLAHVMSSFINGARVPLPEADHGS